MNSAKGLSLVELMIALLILSLVVARGLPAIMDYIRNDRIRAVAEEMRSGLQSARLEAIRRNTTVEFVPNATGWSVVLPAIGMTPAQTLMERAPRSSEASALLAAASNATIAFNGSGRLASPGDFSVDVSPTTGTCAVAGGDARCLRVTASPGGMIRLCDPAQPSTHPLSC